MSKIESIIKIGTTEGRFRMIMPALMRQFKELYSSLDIRGVIGNANELREMLERGELDVAFSGLTPFSPECIDKELLIDERLYLVVSDEMLQCYFPDTYPSCIERFRKGVDIREFSIMPFCRSLPELHCMNILDNLLDKEGLELNVVHTSGHFDLHQKMARENIAACFSLLMYLPHLYEENKVCANRLFAFPISNLLETNPVYILWNKYNAHKEGIDEFNALLKNSVKSLEAYERGYV